MLTNITKSKVVHCKKEAYDVYIGRPSKWGNPYSHLLGKGQFHVPTIAEAIEKYEDYLYSSEYLLSQIHTLKGKTLGCWCAPNACHGDILWKFANQYSICENGAKTGCTFFCDFYSMEWPTEATIWHCKRCNKKLEYAN